MCVYILQSGKDYFDKRIMSRFLLNILIIASSLRYYVLAEVRKINETNSDDLFSGSWLVML